LTAIAEFIQQPLFLLIVGGGITTGIGGILVPWITKQWQDNKAEAEIRVNLLQEMSNISAYAMGQILTAISRYRRFAFAGEKPPFSEANAAELHNEFAAWYTKSYVLASKLTAYFPSSGIDETWSEYSNLMVNIWELAARIYSTATRSEQISIFIEYQENNWKDRLSIVDWSKIKNFHTQELEKLSHLALSYGQVLIIAKILEAPMRKRQTRFKM
jgi:hypothetical protein